MNETSQDTQEVKAPDFAGEEMKMPESSGGQPVEPRESSIINGPLLAMLAVLLIVILAGMYYWFNELNKSNSAPVPTPIERPTPEENNEPESTTAEAQTESLNTVSTSDELSAIEADIEATNLEALDAELQAIEAELDAALQ